MIWLLLACRQPAPDSNPADSEADSADPLETADSEVSTDSDETADSDSGETDDSHETADSDRPDDSRLAFAADNKSERYALVDLATGEKVWNLDLKAHSPDFCEEGNDDVTCGAYGLVHDRDPDNGDDRLLLTYHAMNLTDPNAVGSRASVIERLRLAGDGSLSTDWLIDSLDFQTWFADSPEICAQTAPCTAPTDDEIGWRKCGLTMTHDIELVADDGEHLVLLAADTANDRVLELEYTAGDSCAVVTDVLSADTAPEWTTALYSNDIDEIWLDGVRHWLVTQKGSTDAEGVHHDGRGSVELWYQVDDSWQRRWRFPADPTLHLNAPHNADIYFLHDGLPYLVVGHGAANADYFDGEGHSARDDMGAVSVSRLGATGDFDAYLADVLFTGAGPELGFVRDCDLLADGSWLVSDSGCKGSFAECERTPGIWHVAFDPTTWVAPGLGGAFSGDHADQNFVYGETFLSDSWNCDFDILYEADFAQVHDLGPGFMAAAAAGGETCEAR